jgi:DNA repair exonuclease SbcCD ATPase subunit
MKFLELNIQNFLVLTEARITLADRGLVLVQGVNNADTSANSNGSGKSSIADALCWAIYGTTARGETGDAVVNNKTGKGTMVEVKILDDMTTYRIVRYRKHKTGKNALHVFMDEGFGERDLTKGTDKLTQDVVDKIIGASLDVFAGSIYAGQEKMPDLPNMTDKILKLLIEEAAGINALEEAYKLARENARIAKVALDAALLERTSHEQRLNLHRSALQAAAASEHDWEQNRKAQIAALVDLVRNDLIPQAKQLETQAPRSEIDRLSAEIIAVNSRIAAVSQQQTNLQSLSDALSKATSAMNIKRNAETNCQRVLQSHQAQLDGIDHKVGCPCDECGRPLTANELAAARATWQTRVDAARAALTQATLDAEAAENAQNAAQSAVDFYRRGMTDVSAEVAQRSALEAQRAVLVQKDTQRQQIIAQARNEMATIERLKAETSPFVSQITHLQKLIDDTQKAIADTCGLIAVRQDKYDLEMEVVRVFSPAGVRARVLDEVTPYLNSQTSKYLSILSDGNITAEWSTLTLSKSGELKERFAIDVSSPISSKTFKGLSGGEKRKVRVATALALQDLVSTRATKPIDLFIGDEIDHALDASGLERLMVILDEKARERGTVMVISHNSLKDEIKQVMTVERTASGETKIYETAG